MDYRRYTVGWHPSARLMLHERHIFCTLLAQLASEPLLPIVLLVWYWERIPSIVVMTMMNDDVGYKTEASAHRAMETCGEWSRIVQIDTPDGRKMKAVYSIW